MSKHSLGANSHYRRRVHKTAEQLAQTKRDAQPGFILYSFQRNDEPTAYGCAAIVSPPYDYLTQESVAHPRRRYALLDYFPIPLRLYEYCKQAGL